MKAPVGGGIGEAAIRRRRAADRFGPTRSTARSSAHRRRCREDRPRDAGQGRAGRPAVKRIGAPGPSVALTKRRAGFSPPAAKRSGRGRRCSRRLQRRRRRNAPIRRHRCAAREARPNGRRKQDLRQAGFARNDERGQRRLHCAAISRVAAEKTLGHFRQRKRRRAMRPEQVAPGVDLDLRPGRPVFSASALISASVSLA